MLIEGDDFVKEAVTVGFLEDLQLGLAGNNNFNIDALFNLFGEETIKWWNKLERFWSGDFRSLNEE